MLSLAVYPKIAMTRLVDKSLLWQLAVAASVCLTPLPGCGAKTGVGVPDVPITEDVPNVPCVEVPLEGQEARVSLKTDAQITRADVFFLIDNSNSMMREIDEIRAQLKDVLAPAIYQEIPDTEFGVGTFSDFPMEEYGVDPDDAPFRLHRRMTDDLESVQAALRSVRLANGKDQPEAHIEALYQLATGEGLRRGPTDPQRFRNEWFVEPNVGCPRGGFGMACFRSDAVPVVLLFTDAVMHGGPISGADYTPKKLHFAEFHTWEQMLREITDRRMRVFGLWSGDAVSADLRTLVRMTGALDGAGNPILFNIGKDGEHLGPGVVDAVKQFADAVVFDVGTELSDPKPGDGVDVVSWVREVRPLRAIPMSGIDRIDPEAGKFIGVVAGTQVEFELVVLGQDIERKRDPQRFRLIVIFRGDDKTYLGQGKVDLVIPALDGQGCQPRKASHQ